MKRLFLSIFVVFCLQLPSYADGAAEHCATARKLFSQIYASENDSVRMALAVDLQCEMTATLRNSGDFNFAFEDMENVGNVTSSDGKVHMYSWNILLNNGSSLYYALLRHAEYDKVYELSCKNPIAPDLSSAYDDSNWYGALYYEIHPVHYKDDTSYIVFGLMFPKSASIRAKVVDVLKFGEEGIVLGEEAFMEEENAEGLWRLYFEYDASSIMSLEFDKRKKAIVYDHLSPARVSADGVQLYGPDMSVDSFVFRKGKWFYEADVNVKNKLK